MDVQAEAELIAERQPVARDLRELITVSRIVTDLERVGDEARKIAELTIHYDNDTSPPNHQILRGHVVNVVLGPRAIERIGGLVKGKDVRHEPLEAVEAEVMGEQAGRAGVEPSPP